MKTIGRLHLYENGEYVAISGHWTIPLKKNILIEMLKKGYVKEANLGLHFDSNSQQPNEPVTLSISCGNVAKISLTKDETNELCHYFVDNN